MIAEPRQSRTRHDSKILGPRPYTPETLAERWGCSAEKIRLMFHNGELAGFRLGKLIRIPAIEVERFECALQMNITNSSLTGGSLLSRSDAEQTVADIRLARMTRA